MPEIVMGPTPTLDLSNYTSCIPVERVMESLPYMTLKSTALDLGKLGFIIGMAVGIIGTYYWMKKGRNDGSQKIVE